jgi:hypothetical protein
MYTHANECKNGKIKFKNKIKKKGAEMIKEG